MEEETPVATAVAIDRHKNSHLALKWAVDNLLYNNFGSQCFLVHVRCQNSQNLEEEPLTEAELQKFFLPYRVYCARKGVRD
ncbi:UspA [Corchorus olitorius]|uniref:RING-type E3 ubiquitin transferase n=1 Tax=Corchorus olitorius TaxID=93759 RepID=A0A1R3H724_9ROSI|nr:UspA [Corchorus olitorius]